ncbi:MAG: flavodoxin FldA [Deinococcales bacterium]|nr:flavodoxin FldA [Deinococcales bacterium]
MNLPQPTAPEPTGAPRPIVVYATMFGATELVAEQVAAALGRELGVEVPCRDLAWLEPSALAGFDLIVLGCPTWNIGQLPSHLEARLPELAALDLAGTRLALFGTGDAVGYPDTYLDALDIVAEALLPTGAEPIGRWPTAGYAFLASRAQRGDEFLGLGVDEDNEPERTAERVAAWAAKVAAEYRARAARAALQPA